MEQREKLLFKPPDHKFSPVPTLPLVVGPPHNKQATSLQLLVAATGNVVSSCQAGAEMLLPTSRSSQPSACLPEALHVQKHVEAAAKSLPCSSSGDKNEFQFLQLLQYSNNCRCYIKHTSLFFFFLLLNLYLTDESRNHRKLNVGRDQRSSSPTPIQAWPPRAEFPGPSQSSL